MRTGICLASLSLTMFLLAGMVGCELKTVDRKTDTKPDVKKDDHAGHEHGDEHEHGHEHYHPGHYKSGFVYHTDGLELAVAVMFSAEEDRGTVAITDLPAEGASYKEQFVDLKEVTVVPPADSVTKTEFNLTADNTNDEGKASQFVLEDAKLAVVMAGHYTVKFELDGKEHAYEIFPHSH